MKIVKVSARLPKKSTPPEAYAERARRRRNAERRNREAVANRVLMRLRFSLARRLVKEKEFYFPHQIDWRGRAYPAAKIVDPQADDAGRAFLEFSRGKALGERGARWLAVHLANLYGLGKLSFAERIRWVDDHREEILDSSDRPLEGQQFWTQAEKPWRFLSAAFEWAGYVRQGPGFVSRMPIAMDGTCNGLQHLSALGRDPQGGKWTNLVPAPRPQDLYQEVADRLKRRVEERVGRGEKEARLWLELIDRGLVKQSAMTTPYGVTREGMRDQILEAIRGNGQIRDADAAATYLAPHLAAAIGEVVVQAAKITDWLRGLVRRLVREGLTFSWSTPTGFLVLHDYRTLRARRVRTVAGTFKKCEREPKNKPNKTKQLNGVVANLIHSLDATHMMLTVRELHAQGLRDFAMVHDSYAVHACDVDLMNKAIREQFIRLYDDFSLMTFAQQIRKANPHVEIPDLPQEGNLDLNEIVRSDYFFS